MLLQKAQEIANRVMNQLSPYCQRIAIAGSIRRRRRFVNDIDLVLIPSNQGQLAYQLQQLGKVRIGGSKIIRVTMADADLDVYVATPETFYTLMLIRTGSADHNKMLCGRALRMGMKLHADGSGLFRGDNRIAGDSEASIFEALGLKYKAPEDRDVVGGP